MLGPLDRYTTAPSFGPFGRAPTLVGSREDPAGRQAGEEEEAFDPRVLSNPFHKHVLRWPGQHQGFDAF